PLSFGLSSMALACDGIPAMVRSDEDHPVFLELLLPVLQRTPDPGYLLVRVFYGLFLFGTVPIPMSHIVRVFQVKPGEIRSLLPDTFFRLIRHFLVYTVDIAALVVVGIIDGVQFKAVGMIIHFYMAGLG